MSNTKRTIGRALDSIGEVLVLAVAAVIVVAIAVELVTGFYMILRRMG